MADQIVFDEQAVAESWDRNAKLRDELAARAGKPDNLETSPLDFGLGVAGSAISATGSLIKNLSLGDMSRALRGIVDGSLVEDWYGTAKSAVTGQSEAEIKANRQTEQAARSQSISDALGLEFNKNLTEPQSSSDPIGRAVDAAADVGTKLADSIDKHIVKPVAEPVGKAIESGGEFIKGLRSDDAKTADSSKLYTEDENGYHFGDAWGDPAKLVTRLADTLGTLAPTILAALVTKQAVAPMVTKSMIKRGMASETAAMIGKATADRVAQNAVLVGGVGMSVGQSGDQAREAVTNLSHEELMNSPTYRENVRLINQDPNNQPLTSTQRLELARERTAEAAASYARSDPTTYAGAVAGTALGDSLLFKMITGKKEAAQVTGNILARTAKGFFKGGVGEGAGEAIEEGLQRNIANRTSNAVAGTDIDPMEGVGVAALEAGTLGMMTGGSVGAVTADIHGSSKPATSTDTNPDADTTPQTTIPSGVPGEVDVNTAIRAVAEGRKVPGAFSIGKDADGYRAAYINLGGELRVTQPFMTAEEAQQTAIKATQIPTTQVPPTDEQHATPEAPVAPDDIADIPAYERQGNLSEELLAATQRTQTTPTDQTAAPVNEEQGVMQPTENPITGNPDEPAYTRAGTTNPDVTDPLKKLGREQPRTVSGEITLADNAPSVPATVATPEGVTIEGQADEIIPEAQRLAYNNTINMGGQQGNGVNDNYAPPVTARRVTADQSLDTETVIDPRTPVGQAIVNAGSETDAIFEQLKTVRVTKKGNPFATQKEAQLASRATETPIELPTGGFGVVNKVELEQALNKWGTQPQANFEGAMLGNNELAQYKTADGAWNQAFKKRVENAIFAKGYGNQELLAEIAESTTPEVKNLLTGLMNVSAKLAELRNINNETGATLATAFADAAGIVARSRREGAAVKEMLAQNDMFGGNVNSEAGVLAEWLDVNARSAKKISDVLGRMTSDLLENARNQEQADIFTGQPATPRTVKDAINDERTRQEQQAANNQQRPGQDLFGANPPRLQPSQNGSVPGTTEQGKQGNQPEVTKPETKTKIADFGEKIGGAKKDLWQAIKDGMKGNTEAEIGELPLSKSWPVPDYQNMLDAGTDPWVVALVRAARDIIPAKPRDAYKVARWSQQVKTLRELAVQVAEGALNSQTARLKIHEADLKSRAPASLAGLIDLYVTVGHSKDLSTLRISSGDFSLLNGVEYKPPKTLWYVEQRAPNRALSNWPRMIVTAETRPELLEKFKEKFNELPANPTPKQTTTFEIYSYGDGRGYFVGKKLGRNPVELSDTFASIKEARDYRDTHQAELADKLEKYKEIPKVRRDTNEPRVGEDMRNGQDVTPEMFGDTFGFRGVEFGNWVEQKRRQKDLNDAYDALMDLAAVLNVPPKALSLNGKLAMAFGARGNGGIDPAAAHYEPDSVVINLTKKNGAGSLGHEWWHALDNYFSNIRNQQGGAINITEARDVRLAARGSQYVHSGAVRNDMIAAFGKIIQATNDTEIKTRSQKLDDRRAKDYWTTEHEMTARMFEAYLISKLQDQNVSNDYLANIVSEEEWSVGETIGFDPENSYPYPIAKEMGTIRGAFDNFFSVIDHRTDEDGKVALFSTIKPTTAEKAGKGMKIKEAEMVAREWLKQFKTDIKVHVVADQTAFKQAMEQCGFASTVQSGEIDNAAYLPSAKTVLINASAIKDPARLRQIMRHEILVHHGLRYVVGGDYYNKIINAIRHGYDTSAAIRAAANQVDSAYSDADVMTAFEEAFAHYAENRPTDSGFVGRWWRRVVNLIKTGLARMGFIKQNESERVLDSVLDDIAENMRNGIENGTMVKGPFAKGKLPAKSINIEGMPTSITVDGKERTTVNSNGDQIASTEEEISNFWEWFGDSTNTNYDGEPLVFYHDSNDAFTKIKDGSGRFGGIFALKNQSSGYGKNRIGLYVKGDTMSLGELKNELSSMDDSGASLLSDILKEEIDPETAELITDALTDGSNYPNNEIVIDKIGAFDEATAQEQIQKLRGKLAKNFGFASIETPDEFDGDTIMIVDPLSIKSATGNNGQFDPTNDNILFSRATTADDLLTDTESANSSSFGKADVLLHESGRRLLNRMKEQRKYGLGMLTDLQIDQIYREITGGAVGRYQKLRRQMESDRNDILLDAETRVEPMWEALGVEEKAAFSALIQDATMAKLHPDKALEENSLYKEVKDKLDRARKPETRAEYQQELDTITANHRDLAERYRLTSEAGKDLYKTLRKVYDKQWSDLRAAIEQRINDVMGEGGKALGEKFRLEMERAMRHGPYFPLDRFGDYVVRARKDDQYIRRHFEKRDDAEAALKDFQAQGFNANMTVKEDRGGDQGNMHALGMDVMKLLDKAEENGSSGSELKDAVWQTILEMMPDASYAKHAIHRKRIKGASLDGHRAYLNNVYHYAYHISKIRYGHKMKAELDTLNDQIKAGERGEDSNIKPEDLEVAQQVLNEMNKRHELNMNPKGSPIAGAMGNIGFLFYLGASPAAAVVNLTQNVTVMLPQLAGKFGFLKASKFMLKAMGDYIRHGVFKAGTREAWVSLTRAANGTITADEKAMLNQLYKAGVLDLTQAHSIAARADTDQQDVKPGKQWVRTGMRWAGALFHNAEVLNREVAALTAYRLLKDSDPNIDTEAMLDQVAGMVYDGHGDYAASNRPRYMRGDVMKVLTQFKIYSQMMTYTLFRNAVKAAKWDMGALKTLGAMFGTTWLMAGAMGLPTPAVMLMYAIASGIDDDDDRSGEASFRLGLTEALGPELGELIAKGPLDAMTNLNISGRVALNQLWWRDPKEGTEGDDLTFHFMQQLAGPVLGIGVSAMRGLRDFGNGDIQRGIEGMSPKAIKDLAKAYRQTREGERTRKGDTIIDDVSVWNIAMQLAGFSSADMAKMYDAREYIKGKETKIDDERGKLLADYFDAYRSGDAEALQTVMQRVREFNEAHHQKERITGQTLTQSRQSRKRSMERTQAGTYLSKKREYLRSEGKFLE